VNTKDQTGIFKRFRQQNAKRVTETNSNRSHRDTLSSSLTRRANHAALALTTGDTQNYISQKKAKASIVTSAICNLSNRDW
jgi:hypothetical protein